MSESRIINILFVDAGNSARSILAEALLNRLGAGRFEAFSAGFDPVPTISPYVLGLLHAMRYNTGWLATKPVDAMISRYIPPFDAIVRLSPGLPAGWAVAAVPPGRGHCRLVSRRPARALRQQGDDRARL